jgi:hypothetical protein
MGHLLAGHNSDVEDVRREEFRRARDIFTRLMNLDPKERTKGTSGEIENPNLICVGYWGSFQYFSLQGDHRNALLHAYECTEKYPLIAARDLGLFPADLFSKDYTMLWRKAWMEFTENTEAYNNHKARNKQEKVAFYAQQSLRAGATGVVGAVSMGLAALISTVTFGVVSGAALAAGLHLAKRTWESIPVAPPSIHNVEELEKEISRLTTVLKNLPQELVEEWTRQTHLQLMTLEELKSAISPKSGGKKAALPSDQ